MNTNLTMKSKLALELKPEGGIAFKAFIRVVKSLTNSSGFDSVTVEREPLIIAKDKNEVKQFMLNKYPQFFQNGKIYEKETKDQAQFFYVIIFPLYNWEIQLINEGEWVCSSCGQVHENKYIERPRINEWLFGSSVMFCRSDDDMCLENYKRDKFKNLDFPDDTNYIKSNSPNYIYKCTEKSSGKCYIGKTRNAPFFRWWNHLTKSSSPFGLYLRQTKLSDWTFEVLEELPSDISDTEVFRIESDYIVKFDSINNGFNSLISNSQSAVAGFNSNALTLNFEQNAYNYFCVKRMHKEPVCLKQCEWCKKA